MRFFRRSLVALGLATTLPIVVSAAVAAFYLLKAERDRVESATLSQTEVLTALVDARLQRDLAALDVLTMSSTIQAADRAAFRARGMRVLRNNPAWHRLQLIDAQAGRALVALPTTGETGLVLNPAHRTLVEQVVQDRMALVSGVERLDEPVVWLFVPVEGGDSVRYVLALAVSTDVFQNILIENAPQDATVALVDRGGNFVARSLHYEERVGTPATRFVRAAIEEATRGFYPGETYEGLKNYTAFHTSSRFGWSTHIAVPSALIDAPTSWSFAVAGLAGLGAVLLAGVLVTLVLRDMAERRKADEALRQSQKMEAVGQLTGGIAHDFNNLLTAIIGNLDMIQTRAAGNERLQRMANNALEAARRGAKLASQLLAFSRTQRLVVRRIDLQQLLNGMSGLLTQSVGPSIQLVVDLHPEARFVVTDGNQLELALLNLAVNARDAMNGAGTLRITAKRAVRVDRSLPSGEYVDICVTDTGSGMSEDVLARAAEPFYTTKPTGQGTGLGLSQVYGVVRESGGALNISSVLGKGTTVCMTLKRGSEEFDAPTTRPAARMEDPAHASVSGSSVRVLVVDDDRLVRRFMADSLKGMGHDVTDTADGATALELMDRHRFDLLLVDYAMPGMNGAEVARAAKAKQPKLRILVVSGYADSAALEAAMGSAAQLRKPFDVAELRAAVLEVLVNEPSQESQLAQNDLREPTAT